MNQLKGSRRKAMRLIPLIPLIPSSAWGWEPGQVVKVNEGVAPGVTLLWEAYVGKYNIAITCHPLIFGDRIYHASNGNDGSDPWDISALTSFSRGMRRDNISSSDTRWAQPCLIARVRSLS